jgi:mediator of RNA polymerase II transcription subunit 8
VNHVWDIVSKAREEWETESGSRSAATQTSSVADTHALVAAVGMGKGLKVCCRALSLSFKLAG